jgi:hypothetical protein
MTITEPRTLRLSTPEDLIEAVPFLLGFHPIDSLVLVGLNDSRVEVTARLDLADAQPSSLMQVLEAVALRARCPKAITIVYGEPAAATRLQASLELAAESAAVELVDCLYVAGGRWRSVLCGNLDCCPAEGRDINQSSPIAATAVYAGLVAAPSRADVLAQLDPLPAQERDALRRLLAVEEQQAVEAAGAGALDRYARSQVRAIHTAVRAGARVSDELAARLLVGLALYAIRDRLWLAIDDGRIDGRGLWLDLARRAPSPYDASPLFLFAWGTWRQGNSAVAREAAERALASDPGYTAAELLLSAIEQAIDPRTMSKLRLPNAATS